MIRTVVSCVLASMSMSMHARASESALAGHSFDPSYASITELRAALDEHLITSEHLVEFYRSRMERFDKQGPRINAMIALNADAMEQARRLDREAGSKRRKSLLYGIPFIAKDNYATAGTATSGGSVALLHSMPAIDAFVIRRLLDQGAILLGKANMSELASSYGRLGYSSAGGLTLNPYNTARNASGSSSGSAAAVAADFAPFALGTDTTGSIRGPASVTGVVGLRPTLGLTSRSGIIPSSLSFDTSGALTRSVFDQAIVLDAIAGLDAQDAATWRRSRPVAGYRSAGERSSLKGVRIGIVTNFRGANAEVDAVEQSAERLLQSLGAVLVPTTLPRQFEHLWTMVLEPVGEAEFKPQFERYLRSLGPQDPKTLSQLIVISAELGGADSASPINPERLRALRTADAAQLTDSAAYIRILTEVIPSIRRQLEIIRTRLGVQAFAFSTMSCPASPRFDKDDPSYVCHSDDPYKASYIAAATGCPEVSLPAGRVSGNLPVGYSFMGMPDEERQLLRIARAFERAAPKVPPPLLQ